MATKALNLPPDPRTAVFRRIVAQLRNDPLLRSVVGQNWRVWTGDPGDVDDLPTGDAVTIELTPRLGASGWQDESGMVFPLVIQIHTTIPGTDADDVMNLQGAIENALYMPTNRAASQAFEQALCALGAVDGLIDFQALDDPDPNNRAQGIWDLRGQLKIDVRRTFNP